MKWTEDKDRILKRNYAKGDLEQLAERLGVTKLAVKSRAKVLQLKRKIHPRAVWTKQQLDYLREHYADMHSRDIADAVRHPVSCVHQAARKMGLKKSKEYLAQWGHLVANSEGCKLHQFKKGQPSKNKGKRLEDCMSPESIKRFKAAQFKPGNLPHNAKPVGYERIEKQGGHVYVKVEGKRRMVLKHRYVWEQHNGPVPKGWVVAFKDGNRLNCDIENLYIMSRADNCKRCMAGESEEAKAQRFEKIRKNRNETIRRDRLRIRYGLAPRTRLIKYD